MRKSLPDGLLESEIAAAQRMRSSGGGAAAAAGSSRSPSRTPLPVTARSRPRRPSGLLVLRSASDKGMRPSAEAAADPEWPLVRHHSSTEGPSSLILIDRNSIRLMSMMGGKDRSNPVCYDGTFLRALNHKP